MKNRLFFNILLALLCAFLPMSGCGERQGDLITVITREEGSGTRGAFSELFGLIEKGENGKDYDRTFREAEVTSKTAELLISVALSKNAIGYTSLGTLGGDVKALAIDGVAPSAENIKGKKYLAVRSFFAVTNGEESDATKDFLSYILSAEGGQIIEELGYLPHTEGAPYLPGDVSGEVRISGSSSVYPAVEKLSEAYAKANPRVQIELQQSDSSSGIRDAESGTSDIGLSSRELTPEELGGGLTPRIIALDGIAVVVNKENPINGLTRAEVRAIFAGDIRSWSEISE